MMMMIRDDIDETVMLILGQSRGKVVFKRRLPDGSVSGSGHNDSVFVDADDLCDFRQMRSPEHNLINHTGIYGHCLVLVLQQNAQNSQ